ncbi:MAG: hypothetical protein ACRAUW_13750, partial [Aeromonas sp.]
MLAMLFSLSTPPVTAYSPSKAEKELLLAQEYDPNKLMIETSLGHQQGSKNDRHAPRVFAILSR